MKKLLQISVGTGILLPILILTIFSFGRLWSFPKVLPAEFDLSNWSRALGGGEITLSLVKSLVISLSVALFVTASAFVTSRYIAYSRHKNFLLVLAYLPYLVAPVVLAATLQFYFIYLGLSASIAGVLLAQIFITFPFAVIILSNFWNERVKNIIDLSATLGCSQKKLWRSVVFPLAKSVLLLCFFQIFLVSWFEYGLTSLIGVGAVRTLTVAVFGYVNEANIFLAATASVLLILPPMLLIWINKKYVFSTEVVL